MSTDTGIQFNNRLGSPKSSTPSSPPSSGGVELPFQPNEPVGHQSSPPHNYRHSRAYRHFKNPPQPHMCIRVTTINGEELFINVLSWTRIVIPQEPSDPIPLYGGMRVPPGSPRSPPLVYAVMANPEVLKDSGRHSKDPEERSAMVELMCDFVEAMNPDIKLTRNAVILKDRDISGELKDVWNAVQAQRDREREEQISQQHQQQHYHNMQPQQIYLPKSPQYPHQQQAPPLPNQQYHLQAHNGSLASLTTDNKTLYTEYGGLEGVSISGFMKESQIPQQHEKNVVEKNSHTSVAQSAINIIEDNNSSLKENRPSIANIDDTKKLDSNSGKDITDSTRSKQNQLSLSNDNVGNNTEQNQNSQLQNANNSNNQLQTIIVNNSGLQQQQSISSNVSTISTSSSNTKAVINNITATTTVTATTTNNTTTNTTTTTTTKEKKEKLGGFLPNGCHSIFPRFKNNKHKDKDKDKEKESKSNNSKEKTLLNSFKKSTNAAANAFNSKSQSHQQDDAKSQYDKNCINLENEVEKLDLNKIDSSANEVLIKLKVASSGAK